MSAAKISRGNIFEYNLALLERDLVCSSLHYEAMYPIYYIRHLQNKTEGKLLDRAYMEGRKRELVTLIKMRYCSKTKQAGSYDATEQQNSARSSESVWKKYISREANTLKDV